MAKIVVYYFGILNGMVYLCSITLKQIDMKVGDKLFYTSRRGNLFCATITNVTWGFADAEVSVNGRVVGVERSKIYDVTEEVVVGTTVNPFLGSVVEKKELVKVGECLKLHTYTHADLPKNRNDVFFVYNL